ncbi:PREDICTED: coiled-coil-helix-coiled-coil-helix domain-containing protein 1 [Nanorana parkeri]|uniref:coiled-coil-helix-coiled-coil-helix domain-containing protein 1 n=1 Tax=Nanorana parkeri TaxID=125878 RepID=UPI0008542E9F|nr:PREDICTED: coiled-coil-helix-coiled-coil-helix domain-containing protein 1 [Nanorana parkeri]
MASEAMQFQAKVARLLCRRYGKPVLEPKVPLVLKDSVSSRKEKLSEATCLTEMSVLMTCWKENSFNDKVCSNEIKIFYKCVTQAQADRKAGVQNLTGSLMPAGKVNSLLRKYPNIKHEI